MAGSASRYARALFELASEEGKVDEWSKRLALVRAVLENPAAREVIDNPVLSAEQRMEAVEALDLPGIGKDGLNLMRMLVADRKVGRIGEIADRFEGMADTAAGRVRATVTTAVPLGDDDLASLRRDLGKQLGLDVRLESKVDPAILGGLVLQVGDRLTDGSVAARLDQLRREVLNA